MTRSAQNAPIVLEVERALATAHAVIDVYTSWGAEIKVAEIHQALYDELLEFCNLRVETADTCLRLAEIGRVTDALGLCRSLLEHYLLFILMCRGRKLFQIENQQKLSAEEFNAYFDQRRHELEGLRKEGKTECLGVEKYGGERKCLMYIFEGHKSKDEPDFIVPTHYFHFQEFSPETMRLDPADYFSYTPIDNALSAARKKHRRDDSFRYRHLLSYEGLLRCLELNAIVDAASRPRIEAHYTFLGQFIHPTHDAARRLHERDNYHLGGTSVGLPQQYKDDAKLLVCLYVMYLAAGLAHEAASVLESAPARYITDPGTFKLREATRSVPIDFPYFWFIFNDAPLWDKFNHFVHAPPEQRRKYGQYTNVPTSDVKFARHIYGHLQHALGGWSNIVAGVYVSPLQRYGA